MDGCPGGRGGRGGGGWGFLGRFALLVLVLFLLKWLCWRFLSVGLVGLDEGEVRYPPPMLKDLHYFGVLVATPVCYGGLSTVLYVWYE